VKNLRLVLFKNDFKMEEDLCDIFERAKKILPKIDHIHLIFKCQDRDGSEKEEVNNYNIFYNDHFTPGYAIVFPSGEADRSKLSHIKPYAYLASTISYEITSISLDQFHDYN
jgi:hypothetical protein